MEANVEGAVDFLRVTSKTGPLSLGVCP